MTIVVRVLLYRRVYLLYCTVVIAEAWLAKVGIFVVRSSVSCRQQLLPFRQPEHGENIVDRRY